MMYHRPYSLHSVSTSACLITLILSRRCNYSAL